MPERDRRQQQMDKRLVLPALSVVLVLLSGITSGEETGDENRRSKVVNQPVVKTFSVGNGDIVDCVDIYKQPAFDNPLLYNHEIQMEPSSRPRDIMGKGRRKPFIQAPLDGVDCPAGTVPIRRSSTGASQSEMPRERNLLRKMSPIQLQWNPDSLGHYLALRATRFGDYYGGSADISIHTTKTIEYHNQTSGAFLTIKDDKETPHVNGITVGWFIDYDLYHDYNPRLTSFWNVIDKGCSNTLCPGFVQTSRRIYFGAPFSKVSTIDGDQYVISLLVFKDERTQAWWFACGNDLEPVGYWPASLFTTLTHSARQVGTFGYVYNPTGYQFLSAAMGSGRWADEGFKRAAFVSDIRVVDDKNTSAKPTSYDMILLGDDRFYSLGELRDGGDLALHFFYGGPGGAHNV